MTAFIPFIALYLTDMLSQSIVGIYLVGLVVLKVSIVHYIWLPY